MLFEEGDVEFLSQLGFTRTQANLYLSLLRLGRTDGKTLSKNATIARSAIYRTLNELQKMGLVEKEIATPNKFKATPIKYGLQILMIRRTKELEQFKERTNKFLQKLQTNEEDPTSEKEYKFIMYEGKERIIQRIKLQHEKAQHEVNVLSTPSRWLQIINFCSENYLDALRRKVKYRVVLEKTNGNIEFPPDVNNLLKKPNFELRLNSGCLKTNAAIFDEEEATFSYFPSKALTDSPIIWTNHPSFVSMCKDQFEKIWTQAQSTTENKLKTR